MHYLLYSLNALLMIVMPLALGRWLSRRGHGGWGLFGVGAATFIGAQLLHVPFNLLVEQSGWLPNGGDGGRSLVIFALYLGLSAGVFEEGARYLTYRFWARDARNWENGLMLGAGHGGVEAILLGLLATINFVFFFGFRGGLFQDMVTAETLPLVEAQVTALFEAPLFATVLGALERLFALATHLSLSLLVLQTFTRRRLAWLLLAVGWHAFFNAAGVYAVVAWNAYVAEGILGLLALLSVGIIVALRPAAPEEAVAGALEAETDTPPEAPAVGIDTPLERPDLTVDRLDESRFY